MKFSTTMVLSLAALIAPSLAVPAPVIGTAMKVTGPIVPGGTNVELSGTAEEVIAQLDKLHPGWQNEQPPSEKRPLQARYWKDTPKCERIGGKGALHHAIKEGATHLKNLGNRGCGAAPHDCSRVSCSHGSAVFLCNNNNYPLVVPCNRIGEATDRIADDCIDNTFTIFGKYVDGQWSDTDGYTVFVRDGSC
ncbi:hypothetical protein TWF730_003145 [Orbilia blumenaviensis]|uniref:Uncharacterized protein n=1 Tax=Orbilia blumenaviensis TaxID=1796055 RepID=A0AAV9U5Z1_9PEZI